MPMNRVLCAVGVAAVLLAEPASAARIYNKGTIQLRDPWIRATPPGAEVAAGYVAIRNTGREADRIVGASSPVAARVELHVTTREGGVSKMREAPRLELPARKQLVLRPGGAHLMLVGLRQPLLKGQHIPLTLRFERAGEAHVELEVQSGGAVKLRH
jgi:copper(I)-binding protein